MRRPPSARLRAGRGRALFAVRTKLYQRDCAPNTPVEQKSRDGQRVGEFRCMLLPAETSSCPMNT